PSGEKATFVVETPRPGNVYASWRDLRSQSFTVPSSLAEAIHRPLGSNATPVQETLCPLNVRTSPVSRSHKLTVVSWPPQSSFLPSDEKARAPMVTLAS